MGKGALGPAVGVAGAGVCASADTQLATRKTAEQNTLVIIALVSSLCWSASTVDRAWAGKNRHNVPDMPAPSARPNEVAIELNAVLVALIDDAPQVLTLQDGALLPSGPFESGHPTLQTGLRAWVERQTHHPLGYVEQLYTFADRNRESTMGYRIVSISYLGLTRERAAAGQHEPGWQSFYRYFPWEDWREGPPKLLARAVLPRLKGWVEAVSDGARRERRQKVEGNFDLDAWNEELVLQRYELLYSAGLVPEAGGRRKKPVTDPVPG